VDSADISEQVREMTQIFISRAELLPGGETTGDHRKWQREEMELVERDKNNTDRSVGGLFRGSFKSPHLNLRAIRDDEDGVERCPRCMWELEDGLCLRCHAGLSDDGMTAGDFSDLDDQLSASTYDTSDEEMDLEIDMENRDPDNDPGSWTQDDSDISLDGDGRPIHTVREFPEGGWGVERRGARNAGGHGPVAGFPRMGEVIGWEHGVRYRHSDSPNFGDEEEEGEQDDEAGSLDDFVVNDGATAASGSHRSPGSEPSTISHIAYEGRARELSSMSPTRSSRDSTAQLSNEEDSDEEDSDEGGVVSNGRRRMGSGRGQSDRRISQHVPGGFHILSTSDNEGDSDEATDTLLQAGWSQFDQDEHEENRHPRSDILSGRAGNSDNVDISTAAVGNPSRHAASSSRNAQRHRTHNPGPRPGRLHRGEPASMRSSHTPQALFGDSQGLPESALSNADFIRGTTAPRVRPRREPSVDSTGVATTDVINVLSGDDDLSSDHDLSYLEQFSPLASSSNTSPTTSRSSSRDLSGTRMHHWRQNSKSSGFETPSGRSPQFGHRASSETATATAARSSSVVSSDTALRAPTSQMEPQSPIYINSSPVKSDTTRSSTERTFANQRSESPILNYSTRRQRRINPRADSIFHRNSQGRQGGQTPATNVRAFNARHEVQNRLSRPNIRGGSGFPTGASSSRHARQPTHSPEDREREQAAAEKAAEKAARRRAKDLKRQQHNPFLSAQSRLSRASRLLNEAADRYSDMQGQAGPSNRAENSNPSNAEALWGVEGAGDRDEDMW